MNAKHCRSSSFHAIRDTRGGESGKWYKTGNLESPSRLLLPALVKSPIACLFISAIKIFIPRDREGRRTAKLLPLPFLSFSSLFLPFFQKKKKIVEFAKMSAERATVRRECSRGKGQGVDVVFRSGSTASWNNLCEARQRENGVISLTLFSLRFDIAIHAPASRYSLIVVSTVAITGTPVDYTLSRPRFHPPSPFLLLFLHFPSLLFYTRENKILHSFTARSHASTRRPTSRISFFLLSPCVILIVRSRTMVRGSSPLSSPLAITRMKRY